MDIINNVEIINKKFDTYDEMIAFLFYQIVIDGIDEDVEHIIKNNNHLCCDVATALNDIMHFQDTIDRLKEHLYDKILRSPSMRRYIKDLLKYSRTKIAQSRAFEVVADIMCDIAGIVSEYHYQLKFDNDTLECIIELLCDNDYLKNEASVLFEFIFYKIDGIYDNAFSDYMIAMVNVVASCFYDKEINEEFNIQFYKDELKKLTTLNSAMIKKYCDDYDKRLFFNRDEGKLDIIDVLLNDEDEQLNEEKSKKIEQIIESGSLYSIGNQHVKDMINNNHVDKDDVLLLQKVRKKGFNTYSQYFDYDDDQDIDKFMNNYAYYMYYGLKAKNDKNENIPKILNDISYYFMNIYIDYCEKNDIDEDRINYLYAYDFLLYLAYYLLYDKDSKTQILEFCDSMINNDAIIRDEYTSVSYHFENMPSVVKLTPYDRYESMKVVAVLLHLDDKAISKKFKKLLIACAQQTYNNLSKVNREEHVGYFEFGDDRITNEELHSLSITFIFNYLKEPYYLAPCSAFTYRYRDFLELHTDYYFFKPSKLVDAALENDVEKRSEKERQILEIYDDICMCNNKLLTIDISDIEDEIYALVMFGFHANLDNPFQIKHIMNFNELLVTYAKKLAVFIVTLMNKDKYKNYLEWDIQDKIKFLWIHAINFLMSEEIFRTNDFIPKATDITKDETVKNLENNINEFKTIIDEKEQRIDRLTLMVSELNEQISKSLSDQNKEITKQHNKEVSLLKKELNKKDEEIQALKDNQSELYKLRELMFSLQQEEMEYNQDINYEEELKELFEKYQILIVGGHIKLLNILKTKYPTLKFLHKEVHISSQLVNNCNYVFMCYNFLSHNLYYRIMNIINNNSNIKWDYISARNIDLVEKELYDKLNSL